VCDIESTRRGLLGKAGGVITDNFPAEVTYIQTTVGVRLFNERKCFFKMKHRVRGRKGEI
jgi:hypothetical protein